LAVQLRRHRVERLLGRTRRRSRRDRERPPAPKYARGDLCQTRLLRGAKRGIESQVPPCAQKAAYETGRARTSEGPSKGVGATNGAPNRSPARQLARQSRRPGKGAEHTEEGRCRERRQPLVRKETMNGALSKQ